MSNVSTAQSPTTFKLEKAYTFFMLPFYYDESSFQINTSQEGPKWRKEDKKMGGDDGEFLFPYIMSFLQGQMDEEVLDMDHLSIYCLDENSEFYSKFWNKFAATRHIAETGLGKNMTKLPFKFVTSGSKGFVLPHIFVYETANVGILTFTITLDDDSLNIDNLKLFNYHLHKIFGQLSKCTTPSFQLMNNEDDSIKALKEKELTFARSMIAEHPRKKKEAQEPWTPSSEFTWNVNTLKEMFFSSVSQGRITLFIPPRAHLFTFVQADDVENDCLALDDVAADMVRLSRCVTDRYQLPFEDLEGEDSILQTFKNIYMSVSVEGAAMMAIAKPDNQGFITSMDGDALPRYLWIYILTLIQRYTLLNMERRLTALESMNILDDDSDAKNQAEDKKAEDKKAEEKKAEEKKKQDKENYSNALWKQIKVINKVQVNCHFVEVSPFTQHNQFYLHCCKNLHLPESFDVVEHKMQKMELIVNHDLQELISEQQQQQQTESNRRKVMEHRLTIFVALLTLFQGVVAFKEIFFDEAVLSKSFSFIATIIVFVIVSIAMAIYANYSSKNHNENVKQQSQKQLER